MKKSQMNPYLPRIALFLGASNVAFALPALTPDQIINQVAFGSCMKESKPKPALREVLKAKPDVMLFIGDNIYGDTSDPKKIQKKYARLGADQDFRALRSEVPILATWDDHDFGQNDGGASFRGKDQTKTLMLDFFKEPFHSPRRGRPGVYTSSISGPPGKRVQIILLDTRWFRSPLEHKVFRPFHPRPTKNKNTTILGQAQWQWLEEQLRIPADVRIIASSIQVIAKDRDGGEKWGNFPHERTRLLDLLNRTAGKKLILSGDVHRAELSCLPQNQGGLCDFTSSGITQTMGPRRLMVRDYPNRYRVNTYSQANNFGLIKLDWTKSTPSLLVQLVSESGTVVFDHHL